VFTTNIIKELDYDDTLTLFRCLITEKFFEDKYCGILLIAKKIDKLTKKFVDVELK